MQLQPMHTIYEIPNNALALSFELLDEYEEIARVFVELNKNKPSDKEKILKNFFIKFF